MKKLSGRALIALVPALLLVLSAPVQAGHKEKDDSPARQEELKQAREELRRAREELRKAAAELARVTMEIDPESSTAGFYDFIANPKKAMLGVTIDDGPEKNGEVRGVLITGITPGGGAQKAGLKSGDILLAANGKSLAAKAGEKPDSGHKLREVMTALKPGEQVKIDYEREGKRHTVAVTASRQQDLMSTFFGWREDENFDMPAPPIPPIPPAPPVPPLPPMMGMDGGGLQLAKLDSDLASYFKTDRGVLVIKAPREGTLGLKGGDVITKVDGKPVVSPVEVWEKIGDKKRDDKLKLEIVRQGKGTQLEGTLPRGEHRYLKRIVIDEDDEDSPDEAAKP